MHSDEFFVDVARASFAIARRLREYLAIGVHAPDGEVRHVRELAETATASLQASLAPLELTDSQIHDAVVAAIRELKESRPEAAASLDTQRTLGEVQMEAQSAWRRSGMLPRLVEARELAAGRAMALEPVVAETASLLKSYTRSWAAVGTFAVAATVAFSEGLVLLRGAFAGWAPLWYLAAAMVVLCSGYLLLRPRVTPSWNTASALLGPGAFFSFVGVGAALFIFRHPVGSAFLLGSVPPALAAAAFAYRAHVRCLPRLRHDASQVEASLEEIRLLRAKAIGEVLDNYLMPLARLVVNGELGPSYAETLPDLHFGALNAESQDCLIETPALAELEERIVPGAPVALGVCGPRGAGKSTLIRRYCGRQQDGCRRPVVGIYVPAPVRYDVREFVLHLFTTACLKRLNPHAVPEPRPNALAAAEEEQLRGGLARFSRALRTGGVVALLLGAAFVAASFPLHLSATRSQSSAAAQTETAAQSSASVLSIFPVDDNWLFTTGLSLMLWGTIFLIVASASKPRESATESPQSGASQSGVVGGQTPHADRPSACSAASWLRAVRFQSSFTAGWGGSITLPPGLGGTVDEAVTLAQTQMTLPELVEGCRGFFTQLNADGFEVTIGIDELDKLESPEAAWRFLNEIKALFGAPGTHFLIAVSEDAVRGFEQRGIPIRDALDSALDDVLHVDYLNYRVSADLLDRRIVGLPRPFAVLVYCMSGGLPRELLRAARCLATCSRETRALEEVSTRLLADDAMRKMSAIRVPQPRSSAEQDAVRTIEAYMPRVKAATPREAPELLLQVAAALGDIVVKHVPATCMPEKSEQRGSLPLECLVAYLAYAATVLEVLRAQTNAHSWRSLENCEVDRLARVRQLLSADPGIAVEILAQLRERLALSALPRAVLGVGLSASEPAVPTFGVPAAGDVSVADTDHPANARQLGR